MKIQERFFAAYEECRKQGLIPRAKEYFDAVGTYPQHFYNQRSDMTRGYFQVSWLVPLVKECGVSANWLLTGQGYMFNQ